MSALRLPSNWHTFGFVQKASYLCSTRQARDYSEACAMLAKRGGRRPRVVPSVEIVVRRMEQQHLF